MPAGPGEREVSDKILIRDLVVATRIGWTSEERAARRPVTITIEIDVDLRRAATTDELFDTVDYGRVTIDVAAFVRAAETRLLEHLAEQIAARCLTYRGVETVSVEVEKVDPPIDEDVRSVAVRVQRRRAGGTSQA